MLQEKRIQKLTEKQIENLVCIIRVLPENASKTEWAYALATWISCEFGEDRDKFLNRCKEQGRITLYRR
jgi:hypothetical protein